MIGSTEYGVSKGEDGVPRGTRQLTALVTTIATLLQTATGKGKNKVPLPLTQLIAVSLRFLSGKALHSFLSDLCCVSCRRIQRIMLLYWRTKIIWEDHVVKLRKMLRSRAMVARF